MLQRKIECQRASSRETEQIGLLDVQVVQQAQEILARRERRLGLLFLRRISPSPHIVAQHLILLHERLELLVPGSAIQQQAMYQREGMSCPGNFVIQVRAVHMSGPGLMHPLCHALSSLYGYGALLIIAW